MHIANNRTLRLNTSNHNTNNQTQNSIFKTTRWNESRKSLARTINPRLWMLVRPYSDRSDISYFRQSVCLSRLPFAGSFQTFYKTNVFNHFSSKILVFFINNCLPYPCSFESNSLETYIHRHYTIFGQINRWIRVNFYYLLSSTINELFQSNVMPSL